MNENILGFIKWAAGIAITLAIISIAMIIFNKSEATVLDAASDISDVNSQIAESEVLMYDDIEVSGADVIYAIKKFSDDYMGVEVITGKDTSGTWYGYNVSISSGVATISSESSADLSDALDESSSQYINTGGEFLGEVYRDENGTIIAIAFTQQ